jgi:hypothetical protein
MAKDRWTPDICLWSLPSHDDNDGGRQCASWELKGRVAVNGAIVAEETFEANVVFLFKGNAVWGDLALGIMYCDCRDLIDRGRTEPVDLKQIMLPMECRPNMDDFVDHSSLRVRRTMGCVGDSIWFVIVEPDFTCPDETMVKVWTLDLLSEEEGKWNLHREFTMADVFSHPDTVPKFPMVRQQDDCTLYMLLPEPYNAENEYAHLVCIDLRSSRFVRFQCNRRLALPLMDHPLVFDPDFFNHLEQQI